MAAKFLIQTLFFIFLKPLLGDLSLINSFLAAIYERPLPPPGETLLVTIDSKEYAFKRPDDSDSLLGNVDFDPLLTSLSPINVLSLFASLLVERRIIFIADKLSTLSTCVQAAIAVPPPPSLPLFLSFLLLLTTLHTHRYYIR